jgi:predicted phosphodiesterase
MPAPRGRLDWLATEKGFAMPAPRKTDAQRLLDANLIVSQQSTQIHNLQKELRAIEKHNHDANEIRAAIYGLAEQVPTPPEWLIEARNPKLPGVPMAILSDLHWGERVLPEQVGGVNEYNRKIAKVRLRRWLDTLLDLTLHHMVKPKYPGIVLMLGGDMITGAIHDELKETNDGPVQVALLELQENLIAVIKILAQKFGKVFIPCVVGNHGRETLKPRFKNRVYLSYEWNLYCQLESYFKSNPRVQFFVPVETDAYFVVSGRRFLLTHGDTLGVKGGDGIIGSLGPIARGAIKVANSEAQIARPIDTLVIGHWHTYIPHNDATKAIVNGCMIGYNEYARLQLRVPYTRPTQALWFLHEKHGITASWPIYLDAKRTAASNGEWISWHKQKVTFE